MGIKQDLEESDSQFISIHESINFLSKLERCSDALAINWMIDKKVYDDQILLFRELESVSISSFYDDGHYRDKSGFEDGEYDPHTEKKNTLVAQLKTFLTIGSLSQSPAKDALRYGFARKRFYDTLTVNGVYIAPSEWERAKSFFDDEPALTLSEYLQYHQAHTLEDLEKRQALLSEVEELRTANELLRQENANKEAHLVHYERQLREYPSDLKTKAKIQQLEADLLAAQNCIKEMQRQQVVSGEPTQAISETASPAIIGILLAILKENHPRRTQSYWILQIERMKDRHYPNARAFSKSQLEKVFAAAKKSLKSMEKHSVET